MSSVNNFAGKKFLIAGASRGIGKALVQALYSKGAIVYAVGKTESHLNVLKGEFPNVITICVDLSNWDATTKALENVETLDGLVNCAGFLMPEAIGDIKEESFDKQINLNMKSVVNVSQIVTKKMIAEGRPGSIVNISSINGLRPFAYHLAYCATKAALVMMTQVMAVELGPHKITANVINPGFVDTDMLHEFFQSHAKLGNKSFEEGKAEMVNFVAGRTPTGTSMNPMSQVVNAVLFFLCGENTQITGLRMPIDGGFTMA